jgi:hypothetical protein
VTFATADVVVLTMVGETSKLDVVVVSVVMSATEADELVVLTPVGDPDTLVCVSVPGLVMLWSPQSPQVRVLLWGGRCLWLIDVLVVDASLVEFIIVGLTSSDVVS